MNRKKVITKEELMQVMGESTPQKADTDTSKLYLVEICETP